MRCGSSDLQILALVKLSNRICTKTMISNNLRDAKSFQSVYMALRKYWFLSHECLVNNQIT